MTMTQSPQEKLAACPFCGGRSAIRTSEDADGCYWAKVRCDSCGAESRGKWANSSADTCPIFYAEVRDEWNRRVSEHGGGGEAVAWAVINHCDNDHVHISIGPKNPETPEWRARVGDAYSVRPLVYGDTTPPTPSAPARTDKEQHVNAVRVLWEMGWRWKGEWIAPSAPVVDDAMVERATNAFNHAKWGEGIRAALTAALTPAATPRGESITSKQTGRVCNCGAWSAGEWHHLPACSVHADVPAVLTPAATPNQEQPNG